MWFDVPSEAVFWAASVASPASFLDSCTVKRNIIQVATVRVDQAMHSKQDIDHPTPLCILDKDHQIANIHLVQLLLEQS